MSRVSAICQRTVYPGPDTIDTHRSNHVTTPLTARPSSMSRVSAICQRTVYPGPIPLIPTGLITPSQLHVTGISDMAADRVPGPDTIDTHRTNHVTTFPPPRDSPSQLHVTGISDMSADRVPGSDTIDTHRTNHVTTPRDSPSQLHVTGISDMSADRVPGPDTIDTHRSNHVTTSPQARYGAQQLPPRLD
ncbi:hypothetical protein RRG08_057542 [Elysia crispata]|uniref:Uncharacterized protein n=1 Tax=Elysia crispata TaxID=231223 RepID=A0AAE1DWP2_9GAST|nr:hypothetical protein RRG08_057542 [Elysia crispata]